MYGHIGEGTWVFQTKTEWIDAELRRMLAAGELEAGERLPLARLAARFGTSEIPVREALRMLHRDGLVDLESHRGATVASITWEQIRESISIRTHLELLALREAAPRHTPATLRDAREALEEMEALAGSDPRSAAEGFSEANRRFHERLYEPCDSPLLKELLGRLWDRMWVSRSQWFFYLEREHVRRVQAEHRGLLDAVERHDPNAVEAIAMRHRESNLDAWSRVTEQAARGLGASGGAPAAP